MNKLTILCSLIAVFTLVGCDMRDNTTNGKSGEILYRIGYPKLDSNSIFFDMMPQEMTFTFSEDGTRSEISAGMGLFKSAYIRKTNSDTFFQTVKMLNKKYRSAYDRESFLALNPKFLDIEFIDAGIDTNLMGYSCKVLKFYFPEDSSSHSIFYTEELGGSNPNQGTPFESIPGVMLKYTVENFGVVMDFTADEISINKVDKSNFEVNKDYPEVTPEELKTQIESIFSATE